MKRVLQRMKFRIVGVGFWPWGDIVHSEGVEASTALCGQSLEAGNDDDKAWTEGVETKSRTTCPDCIQIREHVLCRKSEKRSHPCKGG